jgi:hypothetical protein
MGKKSPELWEERPKKEGIGGSGTRSNAEKKGEGGGEALAQEGLEFFFVSFREYWWDGEKGGGGRQRTAFVASPLFCLLPKSPSRASP